MPRLPITSAPILLVLSLAAGCSCGGGESSEQPRTCIGVTCTNEGRCFEEEGRAWCACPAGFHPEGTACVTDNAVVPCAGVECGGHGWCRVDEPATPTCECFPGYRLAALTSLICVPDNPVEAGDDVPDADVVPEIEAETAEDGAAEDGNPGETEAEAEADADEAESDGPTCEPLLGGSCNPTTPCGCPVDQRCVLTAGGPGGLVETCQLAGSDPPGAACLGGEDTCAAGAQCLPMFGRLACEQFCDGDAMCASGVSCLPGILGGTGYGLCSPPDQACTPRSGAGCDAGAACLVIPDPRLRTFCSPAGTAAVGTDCRSDVCAVGLGCYFLDGTLEPRCYEFCLLADPAGCSTGTCQDAFGNGSVGACLS